jgi:YD repeat-containing protein
MSDLPLRGAETLADFARLLARQIEDTEEIRYDIPPPAALVNAASYAGIAPAGTATSAASWIVVRTDYDATGNPTRMRIRKAVAWDNRALGWT